MKLMLLLSFHLDSSEILNVHIFGLSMFEERLSFKHSSVFVILLYNEVTIHVSFQFCRT